MGVAKQHSLKANKGQIPSRDKSRRTLAFVSNDGAVAALEHHSAGACPLQGVVQNEEARALAAPVLQIAVLATAVEGLWPGVQRDLGGAQSMQLAPLPPQGARAALAAAVVGLFDSRDDCRAQGLVGIRVAGDGVPHLSFNPASGLRRSSLLVAPSWPPAVWRIGKFWRIGQI
jgi:hypothetical protein